MRTHFRDSLLGPGTGMCKLSGPVTSQVPRVTCLGCLVLVRFPLRYEVVFPLPPGVPRQGLPILVPR